MSIDDIDDAGKVATRFWRKVDRESSPHGCWLWTGNVDSCGYGMQRARIAGKPHDLKAHRLSYLLAHGAIADDLWCRHLCASQYDFLDLGARRCVNPEHLVLGTPAQNSADRSAHGRACFGDRNPMRGYRTPGTSWERVRAAKLAARAAATVVVPAAPSASGESEGVLTLADIGRLDNLRRYFWRKVDRTTAPDGCWLWTSAVNAYGYGQQYILVRGEAHMMMAHRVSYLLTHGQMDEALLCCHTCDNRRCVNPAHLFLGTHADNLGDMAHKGRAASGERNGSSKLTEDDVRAIRRRLAAGERQRDIARDYGVGQGTISKISSGLSWSHLKSEIS